ncbi:hypothetical protein [Vibrio sp. WXL210]|uniref:hypothetical protein n=1 Tax=Vibrio sp. WXL210 TaxID=3450709 RepID=UPI003EC4E378
MQSRIIEAGSSRHRIALTDTPQASSPQANKATLELLQQQLHTEYSLVQDSDYVHKRALAAQDTYRVNCEFTLVQVISKNITSNLADYIRALEHCEHHTQECNNNRQKAEGLTGTIVGRLPNGEEYTFILCDRIIRQVSRGDWLALAISNLHYSPSACLYFNEYAYNITRDREITLDGSLLHFCDHNNPSMTSWRIWSLILGSSYLALALVKPDIVFVPAYTFIALTIWSIGNGLWNYRRNRQRRAKILAPLHQLTLKLKRNKAQITQQLETISNAFGKVGQQDSPSAE